MKPTFPNIGGRPVLKLSPGKATLPAAKQVFRGRTGDLLACRNERPGPGYDPMLVPVMRRGRRLDRSQPTCAVQAARRRFNADLAWLPGTARALADPVSVRVTLSPQLATLRDRLVADHARVRTA